MQGPPRGPGAGERALAIAAAIRRHYAGRGYVERAPQPLVSRLDPSVRFIGSTISVLKGDLLAGKVAAPGLFVVQPAVRTRNLPRLLDERAVITSPSWFLHAGTVCPPECAAQGLADVCALLTRGVGATLVLRVASADADLRALAERCHPGGVEVDGEPAEHYRHGFGVPGLEGRNINLAAVAGTGAPRNFGNFIAMERAGAAVAYETALGVHHLAAATAGLGHPLRAQPVAGVLALGTQRELKLADALVTSLALLEAGLRPTGRGRGRTLRGYLLALGALQRACGLGPSELERAAFALCGERARAAAIRRFVEVDAVDPGGAAAALRSCLEPGGE